ncbi:septum formation initiator family protein [Weeksellaceae bacterium KMM 9713]|uniref:Septum formation initiator family protein n=1 Tax=Profundicola chukchiensis TaxID=2961959 RepID=A0A9X4N3H2_9FLAO|nr:septum formation initiator family protein [Profundicola chukchiensis]MDG4946224.1 septum formation initiator family protein [Profundicola chukchiensis]MDG4949671.1 septum formation initiator family protein [Profundicola chukchiensis]
MSEETTKMKWYNYLLNKYFIVGLAFVVWMVFFDQNSYLLHKDLDDDIVNLREERAYFKAEIEKEQNHLDRMEKDPREYERLAREKYLMKKENEDIFVIEKKDSLEYE